MLPAVRMPDAVSAPLDLLQSAPAGSRTLDAWIDTVLAGLPLDGSDHRECWQVFDNGSVSGLAQSAVRWSEDLMALLRLGPPDHNYSLGGRDGVLWAWIQPNDDWTPGTHQMRHDHPRGSGLIVACTLPLALAAALVTL